MQVYDQFTLVSENNMWQFGNMVVGCEKTLRGGWKSGHKTIIGDWKWCPFYREGKM